MKLPNWLLGEIADVDARVAAGTSNEAGAVSALARQVMQRSDRGFVRGLVESAIRDGLRDLRKGCGRAATDEAQGELDLFPGLRLPRQLEVSPGRFKPISDMTRRDWVAARVQARTKADNAAGYADALDAAYGRVEHLLTDDVLTTAQVLGRAA